MCADTLGTPSLLPSPPLSFCSPFIGLLPVSYPASPSSLSETLSLSPCLLLPPRPRSLNPKHQQVYAWVLKEAIAAVYKVSSLPAGEKATLMDRAKVCVCMYACTHAYIHACMYVHDMLACIGEYDECMCVCTRICTCIHMYVFENCVSPVYVTMHVCMYAYMYTCMYVFGTL